MFHPLKWGVGMQKRVILFRVGGAQNLYGQSVNVVGAHYESPLTIVKKYFILTVHSFGGKTPLMIGREVCSSM